MKGYQSHSCLRTRLLWTDVVCLWKLYGWKGGDERWAVYYTSTMRRELGPNKILLATRPHNGQYSSYFSIIVNSSSGTLPTRASFPFIPLLFFVTSERISFYFCFYFHSLYLFVSFFLCVLASFHHSNFSDLVFTFFLFTFPFQFFTYLQFFCIFVTILRRIANLFYFASHVVIRFHPKSIVL